MAWVVDVGESFPSLCWTRAVEEHNNSNIIIGMNNFIVTKSGDYYFEAVDARNVNDDDDGLDYIRLYNAFFKGAISQRFKNFFVCFVQITR